MHLIKYLTRLLFDILYTLFRKFSFWFIVILLVGVSLLCVGTYFDITQEEGLIKQPISNHQTQILYHTDSYYNSMRYIGYNYTIKNLIHITSKKHLHIGGYYSLDGDISTYAISPRSIQSYYRTLGIVGEVRVLKVNSLECDIVCEGLQYIHGFKQRYSEILSSSFCTQSVEWIYRFLPSQYSCSVYKGIAKSMLFGSTDELDIQFKEDSKEIGIYHIFSFSGFQIVLLFSLCEKVCIYYLGRGKKSSFFIFFILLVPVILLVGLQPPVLRSGLSALLSASILLLFGRSISSFRALLYSGIILILLNPLYSINPSFQLSFAATLGIIIGNTISTFTKPFIIGAIHKIVSSCVYSLSIYACTLPILLQFDSHPNVVIVWAANTLSAPLVTLATYLIFMIGIPFLQELVVPAIMVCITVLVWIVSIFSSI